ncbi:MAG TPA: hypothetical protein VFY04_11780 [Solirubrobacterales bacterium]|nr:hypothetical protein [Solirubrobacterales bacterium]
MTGHLDSEIQKATEQGERNAQAITLIKKHCAHARVEPSRMHGHSMVEEMTGLPISVREMLCHHGAAPNTISTDLLEGAIRFYGDNCVDCPHRDPQGLPNLKMVAEQKLAEDKALRHRRAEEREARERGAADRARRRAERVSGEPEATKEMVRLLDGVDREVADERGDQLVDLCRLQPELCSPVAAEVLLDTAEDTPNGALFGALLHLDRANRLPRRRLLEVALKALSSVPLGDAARIVVSHRRALRQGDLVGVAFSAMHLAAPPHDFGHPPPVESALLRVLAENDLPWLLDEMIGSIKSDLFRRRVATGAAVQLLLIEPGAADFLLRPLIDALSYADALSPYYEQGRDELLAALSATIAANPEAAAAVIEERAPGLDDEARSALFTAVTAAMREGRNGQNDPDVSRVAVDLSLRRLDGDWGDDVAFAAATFLNNTTSWEPAAMEGRTEKLFGALITLSAPLLDSASPLDLPEGQAAVQYAMEEYGRRINRDAMIREVREALGTLAKNSPRGVAEQVFAILEAPDITAGQSLELYKEAVRLLGGLGGRPELLPKVLPALWTALLHEDQGVRCRAIEAWAEIARVAHRELPGDLAELIPRLLGDPFVVVHTAMVRALREGVRIPEEQLSPSLMALLPLAQHYAQKSDPYELEPILEVLWNQVGRLPEEIAAPLREQCLVHAQHLGRYRKEGFLERRLEAARSLPSFPVRLIEVLSDPSRDGTGPRRDRLWSELRELPPAVIAANLTEIRSAAMGLLPAHHRRAEKFVEVLQRAALWTEAVSLMEEILASRPDDTENAIARDQIATVLELSRVEARLAGADPAGAAEALERAEVAERRFRDAVASRKMPWENEK